jgi:hypothetical protein
MMSDSNLLIPGNKDTNYFNHVFRLNNAQRKFTMLDSQLPDCTLDPSDMNYLDDVNKTHQSHAAMYGMFRGTMQQENPTANIADITLIFCASRL